MTEKRYRFNFYRLLALWSLPTFFLVFTIFLFFSKFNSVSHAQPIDIIGFTFLLLFSVGIFIILFFNHLPSALKTELVLKGKQLTIVRNGREETINFVDIAAIKLYTAKKLPWGFIMKWCLTAKDKDYIISSLTISQLDFERYFHDKTEVKVSLFPKI
ncbi:MAG TPA: hypothetical protein VD794_17170 [Flavisolibacter sp.]|nr:hypothetical protein [Flavisolibacter sp.]